MHFFKDEEQHKNIPLITPIQHSTESPRQWSMAKDERHFRIKWKKQVAITHVIETYINRKS